MCPITAGGGTGGGSGGVANPARIVRNDYLLRTGAIANSVVHTGAAGLYLASIYVEIVEPGTSGVLAPVMLFDTGLGTNSKNICTTISVTGVANYQSGSIIIVSDGSDISFGIGFGGVAGLLQYNAYFALERL